MAETKNTEKQNIEIQKEEEKEKMESVRKADAAVKSMHDFTSPEVLYQELIKSVKKYHPSTDISMIERPIKWLVRHTRIRNVNPVSPISFILSV